MSFLLPANGPLPFLEYLSIYSFALLHPSWRVRAYRCPSYRQPPITPESFDIPITHLPPEPHPEQYGGPDYWSELPALGVSVITCDDASEANDLRTLAAAGGFVTPPSILWLKANSLDSLHAIARGFSFAICHEPNEQYAAVSLIAAPPNSPLFSDFVQYIVAGQSDTAGVFSKPRQTRKYVDLPPHTFCPWLPGDDIFQIWGQFNRELPRHTSALNWRLSSPATEFFRRVVVDLKAVARLRDCTFKYFVTKMLAAARQAEQSG